MRNKINLTLLLIADFVGWRRRVWSFAPSEWQFNPVTGPKAADGLPTHCVTSVQHQIDMDYEDTVARNQTLSEISSKLDIVQREIEEALENLQVSKAQVDQTIRSDLLDVCTIMYRHLAAAKEMTADLGDLIQDLLEDEEDMVFSRAMEMSLSPMGSSTSASRTGSYLDQMVGRSSPSSQEEGDISYMGSRSRVAPRTGLSRSQPMRNESVIDVLADVYLDELHPNRRTPRSSFRDSGTQSWCPDNQQISQLLDQYQDSFSLQYQAHIGDAATLDLHPTPEGYTTETVWFGTNRKLVNRGHVSSIVNVKYASKKRENGLFFQNGRPSERNGPDVVRATSKDMKFGYANVHIRAEDLRPFWERIIEAWTPWLSDRRIYLDTISLITNSSYEDLFEGMNLHSKEDMLLFVHGFNVAFESAAMTAARLQNEIGLRTAFFSWPSGANPFRYTVDEACIGASEQYIADFLLHFLEDAHQRNAQVHCIAHSMGSRGLARALQRIRTLKMQRQADWLKFGQIIFAAPDVDSQLFLDLANFSFADMAEGYTVYSSRDDVAVRASGVVHWHSRAGKHPPYTVVDELVNTIAVDVDDSGDWAHQYFAKSEAVLQDLRYLLQPSMAGMMRAWVEEGGRVPRLTTAKYEEAKLLKLLYP